MDEAMLKVGGEQKRRDLVALFGDLSVDERSRMTEEERNAAI
jgi:hypothetical protein